MAPPRTLIATVRGLCYTIPEAWIRGYCAAHPGATTATAATAWADQAQLEAEFYHQHAPRDPETPDTREHTREADSYRWPD